MSNLKKCELKPDQFKGFIELYVMIPWFQERNILVYVVQGFLNSININFILNPVKFPETCIMVIMPMCPDYGIYARKLLPEKLLPEIGLVSIRILP